MVFCMLSGAGRRCVFAAEMGQDAGKVQENGNAAALELSGSGTVMKAEKHIDMKENPEKSSETLMTFEKGSLVFVTGETEDGWYHVLYQSLEGYVKKEDLSRQEMDIEGLNAEMAANEAETKFVVEAVEKYRTDARRSKIWGTIIVVLVAGIFAVGIVSAVRSNKDSDGEAEDDEYSSGKKMADTGKKRKSSRKRQDLETNRRQELEIEELN